MNNMYEKIFITKYRTKKYIYINYTHLITNKRDATKVQLSLHLNCIKIFSRRNFNKTNIKNAT